MYKNSRSSTTSFSNQQDPYGKLTGPVIKKTCKYLEGIHFVDYKDHELLQKFMTEKGKILPGRTTGASAKQQRQVKQAIRRARVMGLVP
ncbi:MAG: 30S ribosomal protein S18 [Kiritimatiellae bacterium]|nr:30S ribosomal protein S18 [Kiritimatiellia bacterium]